MAAQHWILTNREVGRKRTQGGGFEERILDREREALPVFRVAAYAPTDVARGSVKSEEEWFETLERGVEVVPDDFVDDYRGVAANAEATSLAASKRMFLDLYQTMRDAPEAKRDTLFFIHGFNYTWPSALAHLQRLHEIYVAPPQSPIGRIVYFTWPSWGSLRKYSRDQEIALPSGQLLGRVFSKTVRFYRDFFSPDTRGGDPRPAFCGGRIHLAAHSMGNQVLEEFIRSIRHFDFFDLALFGEVVLLNADEDWTALEPTRPLHGLPALAERIHVYNHTSDDALRASEWTKNSEKRLGRHGPRDLATLPPRTKVVDCSKLSGSSDDPDDAMLAVAKQVLGDQVGARERLVDHWGYMCRPEVVKDLYQVLAAVPSSEIDGRQQRSDRLFRLG
ncbi:MAG: alpha/beta hydrolase [Planctomycetota bacterium]